MAAVKVQIKRGVNTISIDEGNAEYMISKGWERVGKTTEKPAKSTETTKGKEGKKS